MIEIWDYNIDNISRASDFIAKGELSLKDLEFKSSQKSIFQWIKFSNKEKKEIGETLIEFQIEHDFPFLLQNPATPLTSEDAFHSQNNQNLNTIKPMNVI
jgi:hypothetical protein